MVQHHEYQSQPADVIISQFHSPHKFATYFPQIHISVLCIKLTLSKRFPHQNSARVSCMSIQITCSVPRIFLYLTTQTMIRELCKSRGSSLLNNLNSPPVSKLEGKGWIKGAGFYEHGDEPLDSITSGHFLRTLLIINFSWKTLHEEIIVQSSKCREQNLESLGWNAEKH
jgi:hypothetical protein